VIRPQWDVPSNVHAAVTLRTGGVSAAPFASLNVGMHVGDTPAAVEENRRRIRTTLALPEEPAWLEQEHGNRVLDLDRESLALDETARRADAAFTRTRGRICAIQVADCMPVLLASREGTAVAAAHAGWRGLAAGVLEATVKSLGCKASELRAWLGPAISQAHFEVGDEVREAFVSADAEAADCFVRNSAGRWQCDLYGLARQRLAVLGVPCVQGGAFCTYAEPERFFSYRRDGRCGRMVALLWLS
jgi:polyphenol oxidase